MRENEAREIISARVESGARVVSVKTAELSEIKDFLRRCLDRDIPAQLGPGTSSG